MTFSIRSSSVAALVAVLGLPAVVSVQSGNNAASGRDWPTVTGGAGNMRYSPLDQISAQNVARLGAAWTSEKLDAAVSSRAMTVVKDGLMFFTAPPFVYALDAKTGKTVWRYGARPAPGAGRGGAAPRHRSPAREGVAVAEGLVFVGMSDARVVALDEKTGELVWNQLRRRQPARQGTGHFRRSALLGRTRLGRLERRQRLARTSGRARSEDRQGGLALLRDPGRRRERPRDVAGDARPGRAAAAPSGWSARTIRRPGSIYYVTGNGVPQLGGEGRAGDNLYLCSVVALDAKTGTLKWHYQVIHHDIWEGDISIFAGALRRADRRPSAKRHRRDARRRLSVHAGSRDREAAHEGRRAARATGRASEDGRDAAVPGRRRSGAR